MHKFISTQSSEQKLEALWVSQVLILTHTDKNTDMHTHLQQ